MKPFKTNKTEGIALVLPVDVKRRELGVFCKDEDVKCKIVNLTGKSFLNFYHETLMTDTSYPHGGVIYNIPIPTGYTTLIKLSEITEAEAGGIVDFNVDAYREYRQTEQGSYLFVTALESLHSLIRSIGLNEKDNIYLILKQK